MIQGAEQACDSRKIPEKVLFRPRACPSPTWLKMGVASQDPLSIFLFIDIYVYPVQGTDFSLQTINPCADGPLYICLHVGICIRWFLSEEKSQDIDQENPDKEHPSQTQFLMRFFSLWFYCASHKTYYSSMEKDVPQYLVSYSKSSDIYLGLQMMKAF